MNYEKICVVTGSRAEYGLLSGLMQEVKQSEDLVLQVIATNMHLSPEFGLTYREIEKMVLLSTRKLKCCFLPIRQMRPLSLWDWE